MLSWVTAAAFIFTQPPSETHLSDGPAVEAGAHLASSSLPATTRQIPVPAPLATTPPATPTPTAPVAIQQAPQPAAAPLVRPTATPAITASPAASPSPTPAATPPAAPATIPSPTPAATPAPPVAKTAPPEPPSAAAVAVVDQIFTPTTTTASTKASRALAWGESELHSANPAWSNQLAGPWSGYCEAFVEIAYGTRYRYPSATADYLARKTAGTVNEDTDPPAGALVFYGGGPFGHVALATGRGTIITTWGYPGDHYKIREIKLNGLSNPYLGWSSE